MSSATSAAACINNVHVGNESMNLKTAEHALLLSSPSLSILGEGFPQDIIQPVNAYIH